eukprot:5625929-Amphidinium_carterae.3
MSTAVGDNNLQGGKTYNRKKKAVLPRDKRQEQTEEPLSDYNKINIELHSYNNPPTSANACINDAHPQAIHGRSVRLIVPCEPKVQTTGAVTIAN